MVTKARSTLSKRPGSLDMEVEDFGRNQEDFLC